MENPHEKNDFDMEASELNHFAKALESIEAGSS
jgi:hypothetical protein